MTVGRNRYSRIRYQQTVHQGKRDMVMYCQCDEGRTFGLLRGYMARDFKDLAEVRKRPAYTRGEKMKRKSDFYFVLARMAVRGDMIKESKNDN